jgi:cell division septal protein FtsQ
MPRKSQKNRKEVVRYLKYIIIFALSGGIAFYTFQKALISLVEAKLFKIQDIALAPELTFIRSNHLDRLVGQSIYRVDLASVATRLRVQYPEVENLQVLRKFPHTILIDAKRRRPLAYMAMTGHDVLLDEDGIVLSYNALPQESLPFILGAKIQKDVVLGRPLQTGDVRAALEIIHSLQKNQGLKDYRITTINVDNLSKIHFRLSNDVDVIIDREKIPQKLSKLAIILSQGQLNAQEISYIDLRFREPILGKSQKNGNAP